MYDGLVIANHEETFRFIAFQNTENEKSKFIQLINFGNKKKSKTLIKIVYSFSVNVQTTDSLAVLITKRTTNYLCFKPVLIMMTMHYNNMIKNTSLHVNQH